MITNGGGWGSKHKLGHSHQVIACLLADSWGSYHNIRRQARNITVPISYRMLRYLHNTFPTHHSNVHIGLFVHPSVFEYHAGITVCIICQGKLNPRLPTLQFVFASPRGWMGRSTAGCHRWVDPLHHHHLLSYRNYRSKASPSRAVRHSKCSRTLACRVQFRLAASLSTVSNRSRTKTHGRRAGVFWQGKKANLSKQGNKKEYPLLIPVRHPPVFLLAPPKTVPAMQLLYVRIWLAEKVKRACRFALCSQVSYTKPLKAYFVSFNTMDTVSKCSSKFNLLHPTART
ncbi:hypothetical protein HOY80DRAFT_66509 [Tuber brumale]|nr:hypothetical protein HOY80DRAFT_66509 [Tuber brumale]